MKATATASIASLEPPPSIVTMSRVNSKSGTAKNPSSVRMITLSTQPPATPAVTPMIDPANTPSAVAPSPNRTVDRAPVKSRDRISRPNWSVPSQWSADGPVRRTAG